MMKRISILILAVVTISTILSCSKVAIKEPPGAYSQFKLGMSYYEKEDYLRAQKELQKVIYGYPGQAFIDTAQYYFAMTYFEIKSYPEAIGEFQKLLQTYPSSALGDQTQYHIALSYYMQSPHFWNDQADTYSAIDEFGTFLDRYPDSPLKSDAQAKLDQLYDKLARKLYKSGELYLKLNNYDSALLYFGQVRDNYSNTRWAAAAMYYSAVALMKQGKSSDALTEFQNFVTAFPDNKFVKKAQEHISRLTPRASGG